MTDALAGRGLDLTAIEARLEPPFNYDANDVRALLAACRTLREALQPFADDAKDFAGMPDTALVCDEGGPITVGDLRRAVGVLAQTQDPGDHP